MKRPYYQTVISRLKEPRKFIQIIEGPRQIGKSTMVKQVLQSIDIPWMHFAADGVAATNNYWVSDCWQAARTRMQMEHLEEMVLVIDEIQRLRQWSDVVKKEWDADTFNDINIKVVLLGSSRVRLEKGLAESLKGRFETIKMPNWSFAEMEEAFGFTVDEYIYYGGYPGAAGLIADADRWRNYVSGSIVDATINNDILIDTPVSKPALLRQTFELSSSYSVNSWEAGTAAWHVATKAEAVLHIGEGFFVQTNTLQDSEELTFYRPVYHDGYSSGAPAHRYYVSDQQQEDGEHAEEVISSSLDKARDWEKLLINGQVYIVRRDDQGRILRAFDVVGRQVEL